MSAISSQLSFRSSAPWNFNPRVFNIMDSIYAIAFGLGLRTLVDAVSQDLKLTGSLIGLWEGVITLHFLKKMPKSSDPYIAYGVRLFVDFLVTESMERLVLVLIWSAFGLVLADVTPAIWDEVGLNRVWRHFRRDLYTIYDKIPTVAFFPPQRTVRFLPPRDRGRERLGDREPGEFSPSIATSQDTTPIAVVPPSPSPSEPSEPLKHHVPGYYPGDYSDTDTDLGSINRSRTEANDTIVSDLDEGNQSSAVSSPSLTHDEIPDMEEVLIDVGGIEEEVLPVIPKQKEAAFNAFPPTPSDSAARWDLPRDFVEDAKQPPRQDPLPNILDSVEDGGTSSDGWEKINREDAPPTPPAKDRPVGSAGLSIQIPPITPPASSAVTENRRESLPPAYTSHVDGFEDIDMYYNPPDEKRTDNATAAADDDDNHANANNDEHVRNDNDDNNNELSSKIPSGQAGDDFDIDTGAIADLLDVPMSSDGAAQAKADAAKTQAEEAEKEEEERRIRKEAEEERKRKEAEDERKRKEAEEETKRREAEEEEEERKRKEAEDERIRKEAEEERIRKEDERKRKEEETKEKEVEEERKRKEEEETKRKEEERKRNEEEETKRKEEERKRKEEETKRKEEEETKHKEEERKRKEEETKRKEAEELRRETEKKRKADEMAERKKKEDDDAALRKQKQEEAKRQEAEQKRKDEDAAKKEEEEVAERKRKEEGALKKKKEEEQEAAKKKKEVEEQEARDIAEKQGQDEAAAHAQNGDTPGDQVTEEKEDDSKTVHGLDMFGAQHQQGPSETDNVQDSTTPPPQGDFTEEESVISAATTDPPQEAKVRLERMMILRAQMVEVEKRPNELKEKGFDETSPEMKAAEKTLRKFRRQAERRYNAGVQLSRYFEGPSDIFLGTSDPQMVAVKIEENLEQLLAPTSRSISFKLTFGSNASAKKQKPFVRDTLIAYNLLAYTTENEKNRKEYRIEVPEGRFADWLTEYRAIVAKRDSENAEDGDDQG